MADQERVYNDLVAERAQLQVAQIAAGELERVQQKAGFFAIDLPGRIRRITCITAAWTELASSRTGKRP
ncbi:MAG TPA: hypothetical protein VF011_13970 [Terriglobales bacterium]